MRLTKQTNYAVRIILYCAANEGNLSRVPDIAQAYDLSEPFLFKILKPIVDAGIVESVRGRKGGIRLAKPMSEITLYDIVKLTEDNFDLAECFQNDFAGCPLVNGCSFNSALHEALQAFFEVLKKYSIEDLTNAKPELSFLLGIEEMAGPREARH